MLRTKTLLGETYVELTPGQRRTNRRCPKAATLPDGAGHRIGAARRDLPGLRPEDPARLPDLDAGSGGGDRRAGAEPLLRDRQLRTDLHRIRKALPRPQQPEARGLEAVPQRRQDLRSAARPRRRTGEPDPQLERTLQDDRRTRTKTSKRCSAPSRPSRTSRASPSTACSGFAVNADPLSKQLVPVAEELSPTLIEFGELAPEAKKLFEALPAVDEGGADRLPGAAQALPRRLPAAAAGAPNRSCATSTRWSPASASTSTSSPRRSATSPPTFHGDHRERKQAGRKVPLPARDRADQLRETLATYPSRLTTNRNSPYSPPGWAGLLGNGALPGYDTRQCTGGASVTLDPDTADLGSVPRTDPGATLKYNPKTEQRRSRHADAGRTSRKNPKNCWRGSTNSPSTARSAPPAPTPPPASSRKASSRSTAPAKRRSTSTPSNRPAAEAGRSKGAGRGRLNRGRRSAAGCRRRPCGRRSSVSGTLRPSSAKRRLPPPRVTGKTIRRSSSRRSFAIRPWTSWAEPATRMTPSTSSFAAAMSAAKSPERTVVLFQSADSERGRVDVLRHRVHLLGEAAHVGSPSRSGQASAKPS